MATVVHLKRQNGEIVQDCDIYIGRTCNMGGWKLSQSKWHNPYTVGNLRKSNPGMDDNEIRRLSITLYEQHIRGSLLMNDIEELRGKRLGCWCSPLDRRSAVDTTFGCIS
jgi:hypothetical protein